ncbi:MAG: hypothetical protein ACRDGA_14370, partial [Bacteroidota bacterium]
MAVLKSPVGLLKRFRRPQSLNVGELYHEYQDSLEVPDSLESMSIIPDLDSVERLLNGLYGYPSETVYWPTDYHDSEEILLTIW